MSYILRDDDDLQRDEMGLHPSLPYDEHSEEIVEAIRPKFWPAFIEVVDANALGLNPTPQRRIPFKLNEGVRDWPETHFDSHANAKNVQDSPSLWAHTLIIAYQPETSKDLDPAEGSVDHGGTPKTQGTFRSWGYSVVFIEMSRDAIMGGSHKVLHPALIPTLAADVLGLFHGTIDHEIGHSPGKQSPDPILGIPVPNDHSEGSLMTGNRVPTLQDDFTPRSIRRFRSVKSWQN